MSLAQYGVSVGGNYYKLPACIHHSTGYGLYSSPAQWYSTVPDLSSDQISQNKVDALFRAVLSQQKGRDGGGSTHSILAEMGLTGLTGNEQRPPKFKYSKEQLITLSKTPGAKRRPAFLSTAYFNENGVWDPEKWAINERCDGGVVHFEEPKGKRERPADLDREAVGGGKRRTSADPKERILEEQDGIVLSPQRRSFGTGCHVPQQQPPPQPPQGSRRSESPCDVRSSNDRDVHRDQNRRIGSGRFVPRERERDRDRERELSFRSGNDRRDRCERDDRESRDSRVSFRDRQGKDDRRGNRDKGFRRIHEEVEPEWFSGGPTSQSDTIELRGFDEPAHEDRGGAAASAPEKDKPAHASEVGDATGGGGERAKRERRQSWRRQKTPSIEEAQEKPPVPRTTVTSIAVPAKKSGSRPPSSGSISDGATGHSISDRGDHNSQQQQQLPLPRQSQRPEDPESADQNGCEFDFNDLFKLDTISGLFPLSNGPSPDTSGNAGLTGSRFGQFFQHPRQMSPVGHNSSDNSRRSSFQDELLAPIIHGISTNHPVQSSPSPPVASNAYFLPINPAQSQHEGGQQVQQRSILEMLQSGKDAGFQRNDTKNAPLKDLVMSGKVRSVQELEEGLKSLVLGAEYNRQHHNQQPPQQQHHNQQPQQQHQNQQLWTRHQQGGGVVSNGQSNLGSAGAEKEMNAFDKLLSQISDGKITPATPCAVPGGPVHKSKMLSEENCSLQTAARMSQSCAQGNSHLMNILKNAPTERDILAGLVKGPSAMPANLQSNDVMSLLVPSAQTRVQHQQHAMGPSTQQSPQQGGDALTKMLAAASRRSDHFDGSDVVSNFFSDSAIKLGIAHHQHNTSKQQHPPPPGVPLADPIQQKQREILAAILKQQKQQQQHVGQPRQTASSPPRRPPSPSRHADGLGSPRGGRSPHRVDAVQQAILQQQQQQQQQVSRVPSPLVFGQTPPVISHAPSPIHPSHMGQSLGGPAGINSNTLQVQGGHVMQRVPSPLELQVHTQQILQNALIKKKLEEQKEKYRKRQELQGSRSPNAAKFGDVPLAKPSPSPNVNQMLSNIPTSVMRRMQAGKDKDLSKTTNVVQQLQLHQQQQQQLAANKLACSDNKLYHSNMLQSVNSMVCFESNDNKLQQQQPGRVVQGQGFVNGQVHGRQQLHSSVANQQAGQLQGRRIVKSNAGMPNQMQRMGPQQQMMGGQVQQQQQHQQQMQQQQQFMTPNANMNKQILLQHQQRQQMNISPMSAASAATMGHPGMAIRGSQLHAINPAVVNMPPNNFMLRNMVHPPATNTAALSQLTNRMAALQQQQQQQQRAGVDPRQLLQAPNMHNLAVQQMLMGAGNAPRGSVPMNPNGGLHNPTSPLPRKAEPVYPAGAGVPSMGGNGNPNNFMKGSVGGASSGGRHSPSPGGNNLDRWFGSDLKQIMPHLPPVPTGRAHYVEEVEQRQHVHDVSNGSSMPTMRSS